MKRNLSEQWIKASIAGTIWAASEIVLGSFLHNLKVPFSGNILTAIGIIILISISHLWREKGLFWRAGLICAIMKTMSPSAVIFGPMIAIFSESVLLELSTRLLGRNIAGYVLGAMLAMSWNLFHKIGSFIIYYGANIIDVYTNLLKMAQKQLNIRTDIVWLPIIVLLVVYAVFGLLAAIVGIRVGRKMLQQPPHEPVHISKASTSDLHKSVDQFSYSVLWLIADVLLIIASFLMLSFTDWYIWAPVISVIAVVWALRYRRAMRQLSKPKFWIIFVIITLLTAFVFTAGGEGDFWRTGLLTGISMNFRAVVIIMGFSALGTELYNPVIRNFFSRTAFRNLPLAVELSVESLPDFIAAIPDFKSFLKDPVSVFYRVLSHAGSRFSEIRYRNRKVFMVTGDRAQGKTLYTKKLLACLKENHKDVGGFIAERKMEGEETTGYDLVNVENDERETFLGTEPASAYNKIGKFTIFQSGLAFGKKILNKNIHGINRIVVIDEIGALELRGEGWTDSLDELIEKSQNHILIVVRNEYAAMVREKWDLKDAIEIDISSIDVNDACSLIIQA
jgi:nucleoside-triphosphatase THEP1